MRYSVATFDVCTQGFERLRSQSEFILCAYPSGRSGWRTLRAGWLADLDSCERPAGFDHAAARACVQRFAADLRRRWAGKRNPMNLEHGSECLAFLYVHDALHGIDPGPPNLDGMDYLDLEAFADAFKGCRDRSLGAYLFPERPRGMLQACRALATYADLKADAMEARSAGLVDRAMAAEAQCERRYQSLPEFAKW